MRPLFAAGMLVLLGVAGSATADTASDAAYRTCGLHNLGACQNSNQLFWGPAGKSGKSAGKREFRDALTAFLHGAPNLYLGKIAFVPAQIAQNALVGPGNHHDRLSGGNWFFDGFTPHDAPERGAAIISGDGKILVAALLNLEADSAGPDPTDKQMSQFHLRLYSRTHEPDAASIALLQNWARSTVATYTFPKSTLAGTEIFVLDKSRWTRRAL